MIEILVLQNPKVLVNKQEMMFPYKKVEALLYLYGSGKISDKRPDCNAFMGGL